MLCNYTLWRDRNGNKALRITPANGRERGFSVQTNGNLPRTHRDGITDDTPGEVREHVRACGTPRQRNIVGI